DITIHGTNDGPSVGLSGGGGLLGLVDLNVLDILDFGHKQAYSAHDVDGNLQQVQVNYNSGLLGSLTGLLTTQYHFAYDTQLANELGLHVATQTNSPGGLLGGLLGGCTSSLTVSAADGGTVSDQLMNEFLASVHLEGSGGLLQDAVNLKLLSGVTITATDSEGATAHASVGSLLTADVLAGTASTDVVSDTSAGGHVLTATDGGQHLYGLDGNDTLNGGTGNDLLRGGTGDDLIQAGGGNDLLIGGQGNDVMTGGLGTDVFQWSLADAGTGAAPAHDRITDFAGGAASAGGDVLDLRDLLMGEQHFGTDVGNLAEFMHFEFNASTNTTSIDIKSHGAAAGSVVDQHIDLIGMNLVGANTSDHQIIAELLQQGKLITD
ncbi:MAG: type I secretion C-terminal target domain-containing protein, partial [Leptothrix sp. (in: b-proteobacteria)]